ncbi:hypothetical protein SADUNF_Sadunf19G0097700 [Salix dunnii]|uniref:Uncharacterized protein n=1 Tax=Salix dunnii TaxID=1413687 RepID=A0A835MCU4_9ROSI|nr:hypothetical protein SADUNF_Sadunf19G0097700 [Salix dunnii]
MGQEGVNWSVLNNETQAEMLLVFWLRCSQGRGGSHREMTGQLPCLPTTCGRSKSKCWNSLAIALARVPVPPPTSTSEFNPSKTPLHSFIITLETIRASLAIV